VPICYAFYCAVAMIALLFLRETRDIDLRDLDEADPNFKFSTRREKVFADRLSGGFDEPSR
jgi:hypothetical protein